MTTVLEGTHSPKSPYLTDMIWQGLPQAQSRRPKVFPRPPVKNLAYSRIQSPPLQTAPHTAIYSLLPPLSFFLLLPWLILSSSSHLSDFVSRKSARFLRSPVTLCGVFLFSTRFLCFCFFLFLIWFFCFCGKQSSEVEIRKRSWICSFRERESLF